MATPSVLLVCTANLCRSPMAETVLKALLIAMGPAAPLDPNRVESAGTRAAPRPQTVDARAAAALQRSGLKADRKFRSRRVVPEDFERFDLVLAMDLENLDDLRRLCPQHLQSRVKLLLDYAPGLAGHEIPDPYFSPVVAFDRVLGLLGQGLQGLIDSQTRAAEAQSAA
ncbi:protein-tyrosine phosphatase [Paucibacter oligotrophus]|uniref:protein-tyrosine-phosphatase n=1 Tax=Roseateles oligotrophus TaxID=1769250 RepID=A0A840L8E1_9BURK|nr:protein-tyrosine phosphatase [Roseateles oligotrophus]